MPESGAGAPGNLHEHFLPVLRPGLSSGHRSPGLGGSAWLLGGRRASCQDHVFPTLDTRKRWGTGGGVLTVFRTTIYIYIYMYV